MTAATLAQLLVQAATGSADRPAVWSSTGELTYAELHDQAARLARGLIEQGLEPGDRVVIVLPKTLALPVAIFGTLLAGGAYVPIDYLTPAARARTIAADAEPVAVISGRRTMQAMLSGSGSGSGSGDESGGENEPALHWLGRGWFDRPPHPRRPPVSRTLDQVQELDPWPSPVAVPASALAYILYTSGSTGGPKGVAHTNTGALTFVRWAVDRLAVRPRDVLSQHASASFDLSVFDFFGAAMAAARLALVPDSTFGRVAGLCRFIVASGVTVWYSVPSALLRPGTSASLARLRGSDLRQVVFAGEEIPVGPLRELGQNLPPSCRVANWYGPTETNVCTFHDLTAPELEGAREIPIGPPCPYATTAITAAGELLVASPTLMAGYWKRPEATAQALSRLPDGRLYYATGDLVSPAGADGLVFRGRADRLLKVRGHRVQPEEVEQVLRQRVEIDEAAVVKHRPGEVDVLAAVVSLTGDYLSSGGTEPDPGQILDHCRRFLPAYMVPDVVLAVHHLPRTPRGKIDYPSVLDLVRGAGVR